MVAYVPARHSIELLGNVPGKVCGKELFPMPIIWNSMSGLSSRWSQMLKIIGHIGVVEDKAEFQLLFIGLAVLVGEDDALSIDFYAESLDHRI